MSTGTTPGVSAPAVSSEAQPNVEQKQTPAQAEEARLRKLKVNGRELEVSDKDLEVYAQKGLAADEKFKEALPYLEKAVELKPDDIDIANILLQLYGRLSMDEKFEALKKKIKK
jgi:tetratricopeptide (TPR) repeat protein